MRGLPAPIPFEVWADIFGDVTLRRLDRRGSSMPIVMSRQVAERYADLCEPTQPALAAAIRNASGRRDLRKCA